ncbi:MAG: cell division protein FtsQ/DivIB, partial [Ignavibacteriales bacterium]
IIDDQGICLDKNENLDLATLPVISLADVPSKVNEGQQLNAASVKQVRQVMKALPSWFTLQVSEYNCTKDKQLTIYTMDGTQIRLGGPDRLAEKMRLLTEAMKLKNKKDSEAFNYIDLRFKGQPIIRDIHN